MRKRYWHVHDAFEATLRYLKGHEATWAGNEHLVASYQYLKPVVEEIARRAAEQQGLQPRGHTAVKDAALEQMLERGFSICKRLRVFARKTGNLPLLHEVGFSESAFDDGTEEEQLGRCVLMAQRAGEHLELLAPYRISAADVAALHAAIEAFRPLEVARDGVLDQRVLATGSIEKLLSAVRGKFRELDEEVDAFFDAPEYADFRKGYKLARKVRKEAR